jgi:hypothetical protein
MGMKYPYASRKKIEATRQFIAVVLKIKRKRIERMKHIERGIMLAKASNTAYLMRKHGHLFEGIGPVVG